MSLHTRREIVVGAIDALRSLPSLLISLAKQHVALAIEDERRVVRLTAMCGDGEKARRLDKEFRARAWLASRETVMSFDEAYEREVDQWIPGLPK